MDLLLLDAQADNPAALDRAIGLLEQVVSETTADHPFRAEQLSNLGTALLRRSRYSDSLDDIDRAVEFCGQAVSSTRSDNPDAALYLSMLCGALSTRYLRTGSEDDLDAAAQAGEEALAVVPADHPNRFGFMANLGNILLTRYQETGSPQDLDRAQELGEQALAAADDPYPVPRLTNLVRVLRMRFALTGSVEDLDRSIDLAEHAAAAVRATDPNRAMVLMNLCLVLAARFERTGHQADLDRAVETGELAAAAAAGNSSYQTTALSVLGAALRSRFEYTGSLQDLDGAIEVGEQAVAVSPAELPDRAGYLSLLGAALARRAERTGSMADLDRAVEVGEQSVAAAGGHHPRLVTYQGNLALTLQARFDSTGSLADLNRAIELGEQVAAGPEAENPYRANALSGLSSALASRFEHSGAPEDLDRAIELSDQAVAATPSDHPDRAAFLLMLDNVLRILITRTGSADYRDRALSACQEAAGITTAPAWTRATAAARWGRWAIRAEDWLLAADGFALAVDLLGRVAPRSLDRSDQEHELASLGNLGSLATACCLQAGQVQRAVELWEHGRGVMLNQVLDTRTDLTYLAEREPRLAGRFTRLRDLLDTSPRSPDGTAAAGLQGAELLPAAVDSRRGLAADFDAVVTEIRSQPGFDRFLLPPRFGELAAAADSGPLVLINISDIRSDALILRPDDAQVLSLPALDPTAVRGHAAAFQAALDDAAAADPETRGAAEAALADHLACLWDTVTGPILDHLRIDAGPAAGSWPRLWWCPSGMLAFLPLHAAGHHDTRFDPAPLTVIDRVVSSYTPTIRSLIYARRSSPPAVSGQGRCLVVAMPRTPGAEDLPGAAEEASILSQELGGQALVLTGPDATHEAVAQVLPRCPWAHFACHCSSDPANPSASYLLLHDYKASPVTVLEVIRLRLDGAQLAYLSACSTARTGADLPDEAIHLAGAFHLAGYRHVIGTLWPASDQAAVAIAADIYQALSAEGLVRTAGTLHAAVRALRSIHSPRPSLWAAHTHTGS